MSLVDRVVLLGRAGLDTLAAAYAAAGRFDDATQTAQLAVSLVP